MGSACSNSPGDAGLDVHRLCRCMRESSDSRGECGYVARCAALGEVRGRTLKGVRQRIKIVPVDQRVMHLVVEVSRNAFGNACRRTRSKHLRVESGSNALQGSVSTMRTWHGQHGLRTVGRLPPAMPCRKVCRTESYQRGHSPTKPRVRRLPLNQDDHSDTAGGLWRGVRRGYELHLS